MLRYLVDPIFQVVNTAGKPATGGYIEVYVHGTGDKYYCASDFDGTLHPFKIPLDSLGANIVLADDSQTYDVYVYNRYGSLFMSRYNVAPMGTGSEAYSGDVSDATSTFTKDAGDTSEMSSGSTLKVIFTKISKFFASLKTVAFTGSYNDLSNKPTIEEVPTASTAIPSMDGIASAGSSTQWSRGDHVHPTDTSREATANKTTTVRQNGQADNTKFPTEAAVRTAIDSAVSSAYHAAGSKTVAQLTSSLLVSANEGDVYNITDSGSTTSDFIEGAGHPVNVGDNVVVCDVGGVYKFDLLSGFVDLSGYLAANGDGSDVTASFTAASTRTNVTTGEKLSVLFGKIAKWFGDLKALAFKDKVDTADIEDDAVTSGKVKDNETLPVNVTGSASQATVADTGVKLPTAYGGFDRQSGYRLLATMSAPSAYNDRICSFSVFKAQAAQTDPQGKIGTLTVQVRNNNGSFTYGAYYRGIDSQTFTLVVRSNSDNSASIYVYSAGDAYGGIQLALASSSGYPGNPTGLTGLTLYANDTIQATVTGSQVSIRKTVTPIGIGWVPLASISGVGSSKQPVYVNGDGEIRPCTPVFWSSQSADSLTAVSDGLYEFAISWPTGIDTTKAYTLEAEALISKAASELSQLNNGDLQFQLSLLTSNHQILSIGAGAMTNLRGTTGDYTGNTSFLVNLTSNMVANTTLSFQLLFPSNILTLTDTFVFRCRLRFTEAP